MALVQLQVRSDSASAWVAANPVLLAGEPGFETDTGKLKIGDGIRNWADLPYTSGVSLASTAPPAAGSASAGASSLAARSDHSHAMPAALSCATLSVSGEASVGGSLNVTGELRGGPHKHATNDITGLAAFVVSTINSTLKAGSNVALSFDSTTNALTVSSTASTTGGTSPGVTSINGQTGAVTLAVLSASDVVSQITSAIQTLDGITETYDAKAGTVTLGLSSLFGGTYGGTPTTTPLAFLAIPQSVTAVSGSASFSATAVGGTATISYQWEVSADSGITWYAVAGGTSSSLALAYLTAADHGKQYRVRATSGQSDIYSPAATLSTVTLAITSQPVDASVTVGQLVSLSVSATAAGALAYQWSSSTNSGSTWTDVSGATSATYSFTPASVVAGTLYRVAVSSGGATVFSRAALVAAADPPLTITLQPADTIASSCAAALSFDYAYTGSSAVTVQWQRRANSTSAWASVSGATGKILSLTGLVATDSGAQYRAGATVGSRTVYTAVATITVPSLAITEQPANATAFDGQAMFSVAYAGACGSVAIRWEMRLPTGTSWGIVPGQTSDVLSLTGLTRANSGQSYRAVVRVGTQTVTSAEAVLTVEAVSGFATMPADSTAAAGEEVTFSYVWSNAADQTKSWWEVSRDNGVSWTNRQCSELAACDSPKLTFRPLASDDGSQYRVAVKVLATGFIYRSTSAKLTVTSSALLTNLQIGTPPTSIAGDGAGGLLVTVAPARTTNTASSILPDVPQYNAPVRTAVCYTSTNGGSSFSISSLPVAGVYVDGACAGSTWAAICPVTGTIAYSLNRGKQWQAATVDVSFAAAPNLNNGTVPAAFIDHHASAPIPFVASTTSGVYTSPDGIVWTRRSALTTAANATPTLIVTPVAYGNGKYAVVASSGVWTSVNGISWSRSNPSSSITGGDVRFAGGWFVGGGYFSSPSSLTGGPVTVSFTLSSDAAAWSPVSYTTFSEYWSAPASFRSAQIGDGVFMPLIAGLTSMTVAALYPAEDADTWVMASGSANMFRAGGLWQRGKSVAYVSPNRVAIAGYTYASASASGSTTVAVLDMRTPFSGTVPNASAPSAPQSLFASPSSGSISVAWSEPLSSGGLAIDSYSLQYKNSSGTLWTPVTLAAPLATSHVISGLANGVVYDVRVAAVTSAGTGVYATAQATPAVQPPGAPSGLVATPTGPAPAAYPTSNSRYSLSWTAPATSGGSGVTEYVVQAQYVGPSAFPGGWVTLPYGLFTITSSGTTATVTPPVRGVPLAKMSFRVAAKNAIGTGPYSPETGLVSMN